MARVRLPNEARGFAVNVAKGEVHLRHAEHARGMLRTTQLGVTNILGERKARICRDCFPSPAKRPPQRFGQQADTDQDPAPTVDSDGGEHGPSERREGGMPPGSGPDG